MVIILHVESLHPALLTVDNNMRFAEIFVHRGRAALTIKSTLLELSLLLTWPRHMFASLITHHEDCRLIIVLCKVKLFLNHLILLALYPTWRRHHVSRSRIIMVFVDGIFFLFVEEREDLSAATYRTKVLLFVLIHHQIGLEAMCAEVMPRRHISRIRPNRKILWVSL